MLGKIAVWFGKLKIYNHFHILSYNNGFVLNGFLVNIMAIIDYVIHTSRLKSETVENQITISKEKNKWLFQLSFMLILVLLLIYFCCFALMEWSLSLDTEYTTRFKNVKI